MKNIFVVDGNFYLHRVYYTIKPIRRTVAQALCYSFVALVCKDALFCKADRVLVAFDGAEVFRYKVWPQYKANRSDNKSEGVVREGFSDIYSYLPELLAHLADIGLPFIQPRIYEADDVLCSAAIQYKQQGFNVFCGTKDKDAYQYLSDGIKLVDSSAKYKNGEHYTKLIGASDIKSIKGVTADKMLMYQTLIGDKIDNIPSILTPTKARVLIANYASINEAIQSDEFSYLKKQALDLKRNRKLVKMIADVELPEPNALKIRRVSLDDDTRYHLPAPYFDLVEFRSPRTVSLFG